MRLKRLADERASQSSVHAVVIAVRRALACQGIGTPHAKDVWRVLAGLERAYVDELYPAALLPSCKHTLMACMLTATLTLSAFSVCGQPFSWSSASGTSVRGMFLIMWSAGMRKDDAIRLRKESAWRLQDCGCSLRPDPLCKV
jgi:hypothetical protein